MMARLGCGVAAAGLLGLSLAVPAQAADDGYANVFSSLFSAVGLVKSDPPPDIAYRERPLLVLPPQPGCPSRPRGAPPATRPGRRTLTSSAIARNSRRRAPPGSVSATTTNC